MPDQDPYRHIRALAKSIEHIERQSQPEIAPATEHPAPGTTPLSSQRPAAPRRAGRARERHTHEVADLAETLRTARNSKGLTQRELGRLAGVPQSHISKIEGGNVDLRISSLVQLAGILELRLALVPDGNADAAEDGAGNSAPIADPTSAALGKGDGQ